MSLVGVEVSLDVRGLGLGRNEAAGLSHSASFDARQRLLNLGPVTSPFNSAEEVGEQCLNHIVEERRTPLRRLLDLPWN